MSNEKTTVQPQQDDERKAVFQVRGQEVTLTPTSVFKYFAKGNKDITEEEIVLFINFCRFHELNPWMNEAYLVKYDKTKPAQNVVGKAAFSKRAEDDPQYDGFKAGLIIARGSEVVEVEGSFILKTDTLLGGWCDVYRKDRKYPISAKVNLEEYHKGQSTWNQMPRTMIRKVAYVQAHREAFPKKLGNLYTEEEFQNAVVIEPEDEVKKEIENKANKKPVRFEIPETTENHSTIDMGTMNVRNIEKERVRYQQQEEMIVMADEGSGQVGMMGPDF